MINVQLRIGTKCVFFCRWMKMRIANSKYINLYSKESSLKVQRMKRKIYKLKWKIHILNHLSMWCWNETTKEFCNFSPFQIFGCGSKFIMVGIFSTFFFSLCTNDYWRMNKWRNGEKNILTFANKNSFLTLIIYHNYWTS
jgi:hypothetical protein